MSELECEHPIAAYAHIPKARGTTWTRLLRMHYGRKHLDVLHRFWKGLEDNSLHGAAIK